MPDSPEEKVIDSLCRDICKSLRYKGIKEIDFGPDFIDFGCKLGYFRIQVKKKLK